MFKIDPKNDFSRDQRQKAKCKNCVTIYDFNKIDKIMFISCFVILFEIEQNQKYMLNIQSKKQNLNQKNASCWYKYLVRLVHQDESRIMKLTYEFWPTPEYLCRLDMPKLHLKKNKDVLYVNKFYVNGIT